MIKVVAFDLDDTLWDVRPVILRAEKELAAWLTVSVPEFSYDVDTMRFYRQQLLEKEPSLAGKLTELRARVLQSALKQHGLTPSEAAATAAAAMDIFLAWRNRVELFNGALAAIELLSRRFVLGALSNGNADVRRVGLDQHFDFAFSAEQVGAPKPDHALFLAALEHTGVLPEQLVYVGDDPHLDVDAAKRAGLNTIWVRRNQAKAPGETTADQVVSDVRFVPDAIDRIIADRA